MPRRAIHAVVLNLALVAGAAFYLLSPTVYAYFSEVSMSYSRVPAWFAATAPASMTARIFARYNAGSPIAARFRKRLPCYLVDAGARQNQDCAHDIGRGQLVYGPPNFKIPSGRYVAWFGFSRDEACAAGEVRLEVDTKWWSDSGGGPSGGRFRKTLATYAGRIEPGDRIELPFTLKLVDAALGAVEFRAVGVSDCVLLSRIELNEIPAPLR
ncbi:MAG: hypothetical protein ABI665_07260 [Vicinamibacterales bacterium]